MLCRTVENHSDLVWFPGVVNPLMWDIPDFPRLWLSVYLFCIIILEDTFHEPHIIIFELGISIQLPFKLLQPSQSQLLIVWEMRTYFKWKRHLKVAMLVLLDSFL